MRNVKVNITVSFSETEEPITENGGVERMDGVSFKLSESPRRI